MIRHELTTTSRVRMLPMAFLTTALLTACGGGGSDSAVPALQSESVDATSSKPPQTVVSYGPNAVATWNDVGAATILLPPSPTGTPEERQPTYDLDLATLNIAIYDALVAITRSYQPFHASVPITPGQSDLPQASAVHGAAYAVLTRLFPSRSSVYKSTYDQAMAGADAQAIIAAQLGADIATQVLDWRANDGRWTPVSPYVPGTLPGEFRGVNPINQTRPYVRPFAMVRADQFRPDGPPALSSTDYAADVDEVQRMAGTNSTERSQDQSANARFFTDPPPTYSTRNYGRFATSQPTLVQNARLMAALWVGQSDALTGCFEAKYHFNRWRPTSAIRLADTDDNPATVADPSWTPFVATPNHPEYPAAHSCSAGALAEVLQQVFGTRQLQFTLDSKVTGTQQTFDSVDALAKAVQAARIHGGMHFRKSTVDGEVLGTKVGKLLMREHFNSTDRP